MYIHTCGIVSENSNSVETSFSWQCLRYHLLLGGMLKIIPLYTMNQTNLSRKRGRQESRTSGLLKDPGWV